MRDPRHVFDRYGRQLLVSGVDLAGQGRLHAFAAVLATDASEVAAAAAEAAGRYLVGAGVGRVAIASAARDGLQAIDRDLVLLDGPADAEPPVAHYYFAQREYGASVDVAVTDAAAGWREGLAAPARVATLRYETGAPASLEDAVAIGAFAADLLLADVLGVEPLPAIAVCDLRDPEAPRTERQPARQDAAPQASTVPRPGLLRELKEHQALVDAVFADCAANYPREACGLLLRDAAGALCVQPTPNLQDRYHALDPVTYPRTARTAYKLNERLIARAADQGLSLVGIYHSHCDAGAYFSGEDVRCAAPGGEPLYPGVAWLVVSVLGGTVRAAEMFHFDAESGGFAAEPQP